MIDEGMHCPSLCAPPKMCHHRGLDVHQKPSPFYALFNESEAWKGCNAWARSQPIRRKFSLQRELKGREQPAEDCIQGKRGDQSVMPPF
jgi:hypothetical protein